MFVKHPDPEPLPAPVVMGDWGEAAADIFEELQRDFMNSDNGRDRRFNWPVVAERTPMGDWGEAAAESYAEGFTPAMAIEMNALQNAANQVVGFITAFGVSVQQIAPAIEIAIDTVAESIGSFRDSWQAVNEKLAELSRYLDDLEKETPEKKPFDDGAHFEICENPFLESRTKNQWWQWELAQPPIRAPAGENFQIE